MHACQRNRAAPFLERPFCVGRTGVTACRGTGVHAPDRSDAGETIPVSSRRDGVSGRMLTITPVPRRSMLRAVRSRGLGEPPGGDCAVAALCPRQGTAFPRALPADNAFDGGYGGTSDPTPPLASAARSASVASGHRTCSRRIGPAFSGATGGPSGTAGLQGAGLRLHIVPSQLSAGEAPVSQGVMTSRGEYGWGFVPYAGFTDLPFHEAECRWRLGVHEGTLHWLGPVVIPGRKGRIRRKFLIVF